MTIYDVDALARAEYVRMGDSPVSGTLFASEETRRGMLDTYATQDNRSVSLTPFLLNKLELRWGTLDVKTDDEMADGEMRVVFSAA